MVDILLAISLTIGIPYSFILLLLWIWNNEEPSKKRLTSKESENIIK